MKILILMLVSILFFIGCSTSTMVKPDIEKSAIPQKALLYGKIEYSKTNKDYLPTLIHDQADSDITIIYNYKINYNNGSVDYDGINLFNPLVLFGFPMSKSDLMVIGELDIIRHGITEESFQSQCIVKKVRNMFDTGGSSENRRKCLIEVKDNIDLQILNKYKKGNI